MFCGTAQSHQQIPSGVYRMGLHDSLGPVFMRQKNDTDALVVLPDSESAKIVDELKKFKELKPQFAEHGFLYKRGVLMWGPPGSGKTCTLQLIVRTLMEEHDSVAVVIDRPNVAGQCLQALRRIEPDRQVVAILEDLDALCERHGESEYLALLDGESQIDNIVYAATTNYPERLDRRFVDRPSRFDTIRYIGMPEPRARRTYFEAKMPGVSSQEIDRYVSKSNDYSIAHLRELVILTRCFGVPLLEAVDRIDVMRRQPPASDKAPGRTKLGFA
jgi:SpoVK/Ycf46/Vps4 family AAA+-type ATPase